MKNKFLGLFLVLFVSLFYFSINVKADVVVDANDFNVFDYFSDDDLVKIDNTLKNLNSSGGYNFNACVIGNLSSLGTSSYLQLYCGKINNPVFSGYQSSYIRIPVESGTSAPIQLKMSDYSVLSASTNTGNAIQLLFSGLDSSVIFWSDDSLMISTEQYYQYVLSDEEYALVNDPYKKYYNFQNYYSIGNPLFSIINLRLGNYKGFSSNLNVTYCYDNICNENDTEVISYKYGVPDEEIDFIEYLSDIRNDYKLDISKDYKILAGSTQNLNVYYYSVGIPYTINYYYDDVLQENLTENLTGSTGGIIELTDLDLIREDIYFLDTSKEYKLELREGESNIINVYYYSKDVNYNVYIYLDDIFYQSYSYVGVGKVGSTIILEDLESSINIYSLKEGDYKIVLNENSELNYINVYYYSEFFGSKYQDIDTSDKFYLSFDWVYIKELFNLTGTFTQTEQFIIVYSVNMLFYVIVGLVAYFGLKMLFKLLSIFNMF